MHQDPSDPAILPIEIFGYVCNYFDEATIIIAELVSKNWLKVMKKHNENFPISTAVRGEICDLIAKTGNIKLLNWALNQGVCISEHTYKIAAEYNQLELIQRLHKCRKLEFYRLNNHKAVYIGAIFSGHIRIIEWFETIYNFDMENCLVRQIVKIAAENNRLNVLDYFSSNKIFTERVSENYNDMSYARTAIKNGHLQILQWLRKHNAFGWQISMFYREAFNESQIHILEWLYSIPTSENRFHTQPNIIFANLLDWWSHNKDNTYSLDWLLQKNIIDRHMYNNYLEINNKSMWN